MRRTMVLFLIMTLLFGSVVSAEAAKKKKKKVKPVETVLYMHGNYPIGDLIEWVSSISEGTKMIMDTEEPNGSMAKSMSFGPPVVGNAQCTGNELFPSWEGEVTGTIVRNVTWKAHVASAPATVVARLWVDVPFGSCTSETAGVEAFVDPVAEVEVEIPPGQNEIEIVFEGLGKLPVQANMIVEIHRPADTEQGRILYDSADMATQIVFPCIPSGAAKTCTS